MPLIAGLNRRIHCRTLGLGNVFDRDRAPAGEEIFFRGDPIGGGMLVEFSRKDYRVDGAQSRLTY
jgi:hypothetical protein